jgi:hypothetical protein
MAQARIIADGKTRVTQGYAAITAFDDICAAIYKYGYALIAVNIYSNYTTQGCTGNLPDPNGDIVGSHALCLTGYDKVARTLQVRMSWGTDWSDDSGFSERYFNDAAAECYTILDANETKIGQQLYSAITLNSNVPCTFVVNGEPSTVAVNGVITIERGVNHVVTATPDNPGGVVEPAIVQSITPTGATGVLNFNFTPVGNVPKKSLVEMIEELIVAIWNLLLKI